MAINFPDSPSVNDTHTVGDSTWTWDGTKWTIDPAAAGGAVSSVNTQTGAVVLDSDDIAEGATNLYSQWGAATGGINYSGGKVGIGAAAPEGDLDVSGSYTGNVVAMGGATAIDCSTGNYFTKTVSGAVTFSFSNVPSSRSYGLTLEINYTSGSITWPASVYWPGNTAPTLTSGLTQLVILVTSDGGTTWRGNALADFTN